MLQSKAFQIIRTFPPDEMKEFGRFLNSPFFSTGRDLTKLFSYLKKYYPVFDNEKALNIDMIHAKVSGKKSKQEVTRKLLSDLNKQTEKFIALKYFLNNRHEYNITVLKALNKNATQGIFNKLSDEYYREISQDKNIEPNIFEKRMDVLSLISDSYSRNADLKNYFPSFTKVSDNKFLSALSVLYRTRAAHFTFRKNFNYNPSDTLTDSLPEIINHDLLLKIIKKVYPNDYPYFEIYNYLYLSHYMPENIDYFYKLRELFYEKIDQFSHGEAYYIFKYLESYVILNRETVKDSNKESAELTKKMISSNIYSVEPGGEMHEATFLNFIMAFGKNGEEDLAEDFAKQYYRKISAKHRQNVFNLGMAFISMWKGKFKEGLEYLSKTKIDHYFQKNHIYQLEIIFHYELSNFEECLYRIDSYENYLRNSAEVSENIQIKSLNFILFIRQLIKCRFKKDKIKAENLIENVINEKSLYYQEWLLEKINELNKYE